MEFIESPVFSRKLREFLSDEDYSALQQVLVRWPDAGRLVRGGQGLRKIRWKATWADRGKRGGLRVAYCVVSNKMIYMMYIYDKSGQNDLSQAQVRELAAIIREMK